MTLRGLCLNIRQASNPKIWNNLIAFDRSLLPKNAGNRSVRLQDFHDTSNKNQIDQLRIPHIDLQKPARPYQPRRALMYVPGNDDRKLNKISSLHADCICLDCEDGVAIDKKSSARSNIRQIFEGSRTLDFGRSEPTVRVNSVSSEHCKLDIQEIFEGLEQSKLPNSIHLPKVDDPEELDTFCSYFNESVDGKIDRNKRVGLIIFVESARSLLQLENICSRAKSLENKSQLVIEGIVFGSDDFVANIGATRTKVNI